MAFDKSKNDTLIVVDTSTGVFELNVVTKKLKIVFLNDQIVGNEVRKHKVFDKAGPLNKLFSQNPRKHALINSVAVAKNGDLYYTESSSDFEINQVFLTLFLNPSGRLIHYDRKAKKARVLLDRLFFANGVALSPNEDFVVVADFGRGKLIRYFLTGNKADTYSSFVDSLPGSPDNLTPDEKGLWATLFFSSEPDDVIFYQRLTAYPTIRKFITRVLYYSSTMFKRLYVHTQVELFKTFAMTIDSFPTYAFLFPKRSTIVRFNWNGKILAMYHSNDGSHYTHVLDPNDGKLYLGSFTSDFIARVDRKNHD